MSHRLLRGALLPFTTGLAALTVLGVLGSAPAIAASTPLARHPVASTRRPGASALAGSVLRDAVAGVGVLIVLLVIALLVVRFRRDRGRGGAGRARPRGQHENRRPDRRPTAAGLAAANAPQAPYWTTAARPTPPASAGWTSPAGWQGGGLGELSPGASYRPVVAPLPKSSSDYRTTGGGGRRADFSGPPWAPAPQPTRLIGRLPVASAGAPPPEPGRGIRVPGDMAAPPGATTEPSPAISFDLTTPPADFDLSTPAFGLTPPAFDVVPPAFEAAPPAADSAETQAEALPTRQSLGFAAAPVPADYAAPPAEPAPGGDPGPARAADPSYIWDLAATDVFPAATDAAAPTDDAAEGGES